MLFRALAFATFLASSAAADNDSFLRGDRLLGKPPGGGSLGDCEHPGNGFPGGKFAFKLNLLGKMKDTNYNPQSGSNMVIALSEKCKGRNGDNCDAIAETTITLYNSDSDANADVCPEPFMVTDANGADGEAGLCVPDPFEDSDPCIDGEGPTCATEALYAVYGEYYTTFLFDWFQLPQHNITYNLYSLSYQYCSFLARVRGKGDLRFNTCVDDGTTKLCSVGVVKVPQKTAKDISQELLTLCVDLDGDGSATDGVGLFDNIGDDTEVGYFWELDNDGVRNAELRFYYIQDLIDACKGDTECETCYAGVTRGDACS